MNRSGSTCSVAGCDRTPYGGGLCRAHWERQRRGTPLAPPIQGGPVVLGDDLYMPCPPEALPLVDAISEIDARAAIQALRAQSGGRTSEPPEPAS